MFELRRTVKLSGFRKRYVECNVILAATSALAGVTGSIGPSSANGLVVPVVRFNPLTGRRFAMANQSITVFICQGSAPITGITAYVDGFAGTFIKDSELGCGTGPGWQGHVNLVITALSQGTALSIVACNGPQSCNRELDGTATYYFDAPPPVVTGAASATAITGATTTLDFLVSLPGSGVAGTYLFSPACGPYASCTVSPTSAFLSATGPVPVRVSFVATTPQGPFCVQLTASMGTSTASFCTSVSVTAATVNTVSVIFAAATIAATQGTQARASVTYFGAPPDGNAPATWAAENANVATVSTGGFVTGVMAGSARIFATVGGVTNSSTIFVTASSSVPVVTFSVPTGTRVSVSGLQVYITACVNGTVGVSTVTPYLNSAPVTLIGGYPPNCPPGSSGQTGRVDLTLNVGANTLSVVACVTPGANCNREQDAVATYNYNPLSVTAAAASLTVAPGRVAPVGFTARLSSTGILGTYQFSAVCTPFTCTAPPPATIGPSGSALVNVSVPVAYADTGKTAPVTLTASMGTTTASATTQITVGPEPVTAIAVTFGASPINIAQTTPASARVTYESGRFKDGESANWSSANTTIATVNSVTGVVTGEGVGTTYIKATVRSFTDSASIRVVSAGAVVTPTLQAISLPISAPSSLRFYVRNTGGPNTFTLQATCTGGAILSGCVAPAPITVNTLDSAAVVLTVGTGSTIGDTSTVTLLATAPGVSAAGQYKVTLSAGSAIAVRVQDVNPNSSIARNQCLTIAASDAAAFECGDLRLVHRLPAVQTMNRARAPTLIYNSRHQSPAALVAADVTVIGITPTSTLDVTLAVAGAAPVTRSYPWNPACLGVKCRIVVPTAMAPTGLTGIYPYTLTTKITSGATTYTATDTSSLVMVDRSQSPFGAGWWLDGLEQLVSPADTTQWLWVGGDGSTRLFVKTVGDVFVAQQFVDRPDTLLRLAGGLWHRQLRNGAFVEFNSTGQHIRTVGREGHATRFVQSTRLDSIVVPIPSLSASRRAYGFTYDVNGKVSSVTSPTDNGLTRATSLAHAVPALTTAITDPDGLAVTFSYDAANARVRVRSNKLNDSTVFAYDSAGGLAQVAVKMRLDPALVTTFCASETRTLDRCADGTDNTPQPLANVVTRLVGPRADVVQVTNFIVNRFGGPDTVTNALGQRTRVERSAQFPALATKWVSASGFERRAYYNARALPDSTEDVDPYEAGCVDRSCNAVTRYAYHPTWDEVRSVRGPTGDSTTTFYGTARALADSIQVGANPARRWLFTYSPEVQVTGVQEPAGLPSTLHYDELGNLARTESPLRFATDYFRNAVGLDTLVLTPTDAAQTPGLRQQRRTTYDAMDRVDSVVTIGAKVSYILRSPPLADAAPVTADTLRSQRIYDLEGRPINIIAEAAASPNIYPPSDFGVKVDEGWSYDPAGRVRTHSKNLGSDSTSYDAAGNVTRVATRSGGGFLQQFDVLNRVSQRTVAARTYPRQRCEGLQTGPITGSGGCFVVFPAYPNAAGGDYTIPPDVATFMYDAIGDVLTADNREATVHRQYFRSGALRRDSSSYLAAQGALFTHGKGLAFHYDLAGRRDTLTLASGGKIAYSYRAEDGAMTGVLDPLGTPYRYVYDLAGRIDSVAIGVPALGVSPIREKRTYDADSRQFARERVSAAISGVLSSENLTFDAQDRVTAASYLTAANAAPSDSTLITYSGLGAVLARERRETFNWETEEFRVDALGNVLRNRSTTREFSADMPQHSLYSRRGALQVRKALPSLDYPLQRDSLLQGFDADGHTILTHHHGRNRFNDVTVDIPGRSYYGADGKLRVVQRYNGVSGNGQGGAFEEYRYDALGRRVMVIGLASGTAPPGCDVVPTVPVCSPLCTISCDGSPRVTWTTWDGDRIVSEERRAYPDVPTGPTPVVFGSVEYVHGLALDHPLAVLDPNVPTGVRVLNPHWRGVFESSVTRDGTGADCSLVTGASCQKIAWPAGQAIYVRPWLVGTSTAPYTWGGSLLTDQQDGTGQLYRRNRYYDPDAGRFTQEDPIGVAGGMNLYGFAGGDPVNYSDPFGLWPTWSDVSRALYRLGAKITLIVKAGLPHAEPEPPDMIPEPPPIEQPATGTRRRSPMRDSTSKDREERSPSKSLRFNSPIETLRDFWNSPAPSWLPLSPFNPRGVPPLLPLPVPIILIVP